MSGYDKPIAGMGSFAGKKLFIRWPRRRPSLDRIKICCEDKMVPSGWVRGRSLRPPFISVYVRSNKRIFCVGKFRYCYRDFPSLRQMVAFRSAMRMTRRRTWAAIMLRQRLRTRSKFSVAEL